MKRLSGKKYEKYIRHEKYKERKLLNNSAKNNIKKQFPENIDIFDRNFISLIEDIVSDSSSDSNLIELDCRHIKDFMPYNLLYTKQYFVKQDVSLRRVFLPRDSVLAQLFKFLNFNNGKALNKTGHSLQPLNQTREYQQGTEFITNNKHNFENCQQVQISQINDIIDKIIFLEERLNTQNRIFTQDNKIHPVRTIFHEVIANVKDHAYEANEANKPVEIYIGSDSEEKIWIMATDKGKTIPVTIKDKANQGFSGFEKIINSIKDGVNDGKLIQAATKKNLSSLDDNIGRGKGLTTIIEKTKTINNSRLVIYSNMGAYFFPENKVKTLPFSFSGTLIYWEYKHPKETNN